MTFLLHDLVVKISLIFLNIFFLIFIAITLSFEESSYSDHFHRLLPDCLSWIIPSVSIFGILCFNMWYGTRENTTYVLCALWAYKSMVFFRLLTLLIKISNFATRTSYEAYCFLAVETDTTNLSFSNSSAPSFFCMSLSQIILWPSLLHELPKSYVIVFIASELVKLLLQVFACSKVMDGMNLASFYFLGVVCVCCCLVGLVEVGTLHHISRLVVSWTEELTDLMKSKSRLLEVLSGLQDILQEIQRLKIMNSIYMDSDEVEEKKLMVRNIEMVQLLADNYQFLLMFDCTESRCVLLTDSSIQHQNINKPTGMKGIQSCYDLFTCPLVAPVTSRIEVVFLRQKMLELWSHHISPLLWVENLRPSFAVQLAQPCPEGTALGKPGPEKFFCDDFYLTAALRNCLCFVVDSLMTKYGRRASTSTGVGMKGSSSNDGEATGCPSIVVIINSVSSAYADPVVQICISYDCMEYAEGTVPHNRGFDSSLLLSASAMAHFIGGSLTFAEDISDEYCLKRCNKISLVAPCVPEVPDYSSDGDSLHSKDDEGTILHDVKEKPVYKVFIAVKPSESNFVKKLVCVVGEDYMNFTANDNFALANEAEANYDFVVSFSFESCFELRKRFGYSGILLHLYDPSVPKSKSLNKFDIVVLCSTSLPLPSNTTDIEYIMNEMKYFVEKGVVSERPPVNGSRRRGNAKAPVRKEDTWKLNSWMTTTQQAKYNRENGSHKRWNTINLMAKVTKHIMLFKEAVMCCIFYRYGHVFETKHVDYSYSGYHLNFNKFVFGVPIFQGPVEDDYYLCLFSGESLTWPCRTCLLVVSFLIDISAAFLLPCNDKFMFALSVSVGILRLFFVFWSAPTYSWLRSNVKLFRNIKFSYFLTAFGILYLLQVSVFSCGAGQADSVNLLIECGFYFSDILTIWIFLFPWPFPMLLSVCLLVRLVWYTWAFTAAGHMLPSTCLSFVLLEVMLFSICIIMIYRMEVALRPLYQAYRRKRHIDLFLKKHSVQFAQDMAAPLEMIAVLKHSLLVCVRNAVFDNTLEFSQTIIMDATSFEVAHLKLRELYFELIWMKKLMPEGGAVSSKPQTQVAPLPLNMRRDIVSLKEDLFKLCQAFDTNQTLLPMNLCVEVYLQIDSSLNNVRTDTDMLQMVMINSLVAAHDNIRKSLHRPELKVGFSPGSAEVHEILVRVYPVRDAVGIPKFIDKKFLTIEITDTGDPPPTRTDYEFTFGQDICHRTLAGVGGSHQSVSIRHYKYACQQRITFPYWSMPGSANGNVGNPFGDVKKSVASNNLPNQLFSCSSELTRTSRNIQSLVVGSNEKLNSNRVVINMKILLVTTFLNEDSTADANLFCSSGNRNNSTEYAGFKCFICNDIRTLEEYEGLLDFTVIIIDTLSLNTPMPSSQTNSFVTSDIVVKMLRSNGYKSAIVCLKQSKGEEVAGLLTYNGVLVKPLNKRSRVELVDIVTSFIINYSLWLDAN